MQVPLQITFKGIHASDGIEARIREKTGELERLFARIISCRVVVDAPHRSHHKGTHYSVHIDITMPGGGKVLVNRDPGPEATHEDVYVAIRDAFNAAERQLQDHVHRRGGKIKAHEAPAHGSIAQIFPEEGYGFIAAADGQEIYFHRNSVLNEGFDHLEVGDEVRFAVAEGEGEKGPQASSVAPVGKHHIVD